MKEALELFKNDDNKKYITERNSDFLEETCAVKILKYNDYFLRPPLVAKCMYDFLSGSVGSHTPLRYDLNFRNYYYVTGGSIKGSIIYIPPYWWFTIKFEELSSVCSFKYRTYMNFLAISPQVIQSILQNQNTKLKNVKKFVSNKTLDKNKKD